MNQEANNIMCHDCLDTGWQENREEGRYPCTCITETEPYQLLQARCAELEAAKAIPEGWLKAIDEVLVCNHIGTAEATDSYEVAKEKLNKLIQWEIDVATDPSVNGGYELTRVEI